jgi:UDP-N-acetylmuramoylalanine--D-glutamate ligase
MKGPWGAGRFERVLVYGLGLSGKAAARLLLAHGVEVVGVDGRRMDQLDLGELAGRMTLHLGSEPTSLPADCGDVDGVVVSPGIPPGRPLLAEAHRLRIPVLAEVELAFPLLNGPVVAVTGSNGKSTTTALTGAMLAASGFAVEVCGNIGEPLTGKVDGPAGRIFVVEMSSFQIEGIHTFKPQAAALLNLAEDHLDRYAGMTEYAAAKKALFKNQDAADAAVFNADDAATVATSTLARKRLFSRLGPVADGCFADASGRVVEVAPGEAPRELFSAADVPLAGVQNLENAMAAALLARAFGAEPARLRAGLLAFRGLPHRLERVAEIAGVSYYDDSKGTNPAATLKSIEGFADGTLHLILGGRNKGADLSALVPLVRAKAKRAYLIGEAAAELEPALSGKVPYEVAATLDRAVASAAAVAQPGEAVVLSPACASFDQFRNFVHRGESFKALVHALAGGRDAH